MFEFIRSDLKRLAAYTIPTGKSSIPVDKLDANESPYDLPPQLQDKLIWAQKQIENNRYPDASYRQLKSAIAEYVNESASTEFVTPNYISVGNGSDELIRSILIATCVGEAAAVMVFEPTFSMYRILAETLGITVVNIPRNSEDFSMDVAAASAAIETHQTDIRVVFVVHPNSPTGNALTAAELEWLSNLPPEILVVVDEAYFEFSRDSIVSKIAQHPNWMILRTFSKAFRLAAHRVGYAIANPGLTAYLEKVRLPYNLSAGTQAAASIALNHRDLILPVIEEILSDRAQIYSQLNRYQQLKIWPSAANFIYLRSTQPKSVELVEQLQQIGTIVRYTGGGIRITVGTREENERVLARIEQILKG